MIDPKSCNVAIDANALDPPGDKIGRSRDVDRLLSLWRNGDINLIVPHSVLAEFQSPGTPAAIREEAASAIFTIQTALTGDELRTRRIIEQELQGNARPGRHAADAQHLAEAAKYGGYFITHDERILRRSGNLRDVLGRSLQVVNLAQFLEICDEFYPVTCQLP